MIRVKQFRPNNEAKSFSSVQDLIKRVRLKSLADSEDIDSENGMKVMESSNMNELLLKLQPDINLPIEKPLVKPVNDSLSLLLQDDNLAKDLEQYQINKILVRNVRKRLHIKKLFDVQKKSLKVIISKKFCDIGICAPTGSGKTLSYVLPILNYCINRSIRQLRAIVVVPSRELCQQVLDTISCCVYKTDVTVLVLNTHIQQPLETTDILITTLADFLSLHKFTGGFNLTSLRYLVLDEVDRIFKIAGYEKIDDLMKILSIDEPVLVAKDLTSKDFSLNSRVQKIFLSATITRNPLELKSLRLSYPKYINHDYLLPSNIETNLIITKYSFKDRLNKLLKLLLNTFKARKDSKILVFFQTIKELVRVSKVLNKAGEEFKTKFLSSKQKVSKRLRVLKEFEENKFKILLTTDLLARGIDIKDLNCVINFDLPNKKKAVLHRAGRTGRAGTKGVCFFFVPEDVKQSFEIDLIKFGCTPKIIKI